MAKYCSIPDCGRHHHAKGFCKNHHHRLLKHGDPLGGVTPNGEPMRWIHEVAMRHIGGACLAWPYAKGAGYGKISINGKLVLASRYICELLHGAPPTPNHEAAHSCGNGHESCVSPGHLSWKTRAENEADKLVHGTVGRGERNPSAKLTEDDVRKIISLKGEVKQRKLAEMYGVSKKHIGDIHTARRWSWLSTHTTTTQPAE